MAEQLILIEPDEAQFRLDEHTRDIGRRGIAEVRRILAEKAGDAGQITEPAAA